MLTGTVIRKLPDDRLSGGDIVIGERSPSEMHSTVDGDGIYVCVRVHQRGKRDDERRRESDEMLHDYS